MKVTRFEDLECWREARQLANMVFPMTLETSFRGRLRLVDQMTGAAISVMNNIAEGFDSQSNAEFIRFLGYARRSTSEVQTCLYVAVDNHFVTQKQFAEVYDQASRARQLVDGLLRYLRSCRRTQRTKPAQQAQRANAVTCE